MAKVVTRGIRNNNPANIRRSNSAWLGLCPKRNSVALVRGGIPRFEKYDADFCQFSNVEYGIRALIILIKNYNTFHKIDTISGILERFAPHIENNTNYYITYVCIQSDLQPDESLGLKDLYITIQDNKVWHIDQDVKHKLYKICKAICMMESHFDLTEKLFNRSFNMISHVHETY